MQHLDEGMIHAWLDGALSPEEAAQANAHVESCPQCQAAVAEARGFIAASSRILTALDDAPRGVIPIAPRQRVQPWVWRVAATVLVVATGTMVLVKERGSDSRSAMNSTSESPAQSAAPAFAPPVTVLSGQPAADSAAGPRATGRRTTAPIRGASPGGIVSGVTPAPIRGTSKQSQTEANDESRASADVRRSDVPAELKSSAVAPMAAASIPAAGRAASPLRQSVGIVAGGTSETAPREVASARLPTGTQTFYEIAPGDTVMLEEQSSPQFQTVATALSARAPSRAEKAAASVESQQKAEPAPPPSAAALRDAQVGERHSISWLDSSTRHVIILSGRHSQEELERIREQIQRLRAAQSRKNPE